MSDTSSTTRPVRSRRFAPTIRRCVALAAVATASMAVLGVAAAAPSQAHPAGTSTSSAQSADPAGATAAAVPRADSVYGIQPNGDMLCYRHLGYSTGQPTWTGPTTVGTGWNSFRTVFTGSGAIYGIANDGRVFYYRHDGYARCGGKASDWTFPGGKVVTTGWSNVVTAFGMPGTSAGTGGIVYTIDTAGNLRWWRHDGWATGGTTWSGGTVVGTGWNGLVKVFPGQNGEIYGISAEGDLREYIHLGWQDGTVRWAPIHTVGVGWSAYSKVFSGGGGGVIYGVRADTHELIWFRHIGHARGTVSWAGPSTVGTSWGSFATLLVHSFAPPLQ